jgi:hypothetical protein
VRCDLRSSPSRPHATRMRGSSQAFATSARGSAGT